MTKTRGEKLEPKDLDNQLTEIYLHNVVVVKNIMNHCVTSGIRHYRLSSNLFPLVGLLKPLEELQNNSTICKLLEEAGNVAKRAGLTISSHPSQFVVLPSATPSTVTNAIQDLEIHGWVHDVLGLPRNYTNPINIHPGTSKPDAQTIYDRFMKAYERLSESVQSRLVLENEDKGIWNCESLYEVFGDTLPLTFDNLHHKCNPSKEEDPDVWAKRFKTTWTRYDKRAVFHWSEGMSDEGRLRRSHSDFFSYVPEVVLKNPDITWECEVKEKDKAITKILSEMN